MSIIEQQKRVDFLIIHLIHNIAWAFVGEQLQQCVLMTVVCLNAV